MTIRKLTPETMNDWFDFFENRAFTDHDEWEGCYCTAFYYPKPAEYPGESNRRKDYAKWLIDTERMKGFLAYEDGKVVGWVNVNDKRHFPRLSEIYDKNEKTMSVVCFIVQKEHRRKGIAQKLLDAIIADAVDGGYSIIEAYPKKKAKSEYGSWNGPYEMYAKNGFVDHKIDKTNVVRKHVE
jgi:GNAT superfamily N-acetyltransferase